MISFTTPDREGKSFKHYYCHVRTNDQANAPRHNDTKPKTRDYCQSIPKYPAEDECYKKEG